jgi:hypothetical protein
MKINNSMFWWQGGEFEYGLVFITLGMNIHHMNGFTNCKIMYSEHMLYSAVLMYDQQGSQSQQPLDVGNNKNRDGKKKKP